MNQTVRGFFRKEWTQTLRDKRMRVLLIVAPVIQMTLFGLALTNEVKNVKLALSAPASDTISRRLYDRCLASGYFIAAHVKGPDPFEWVRSGDAEAVLVAPPGGLERALGRNGAQIQVLIDASNVLKAQSAERYIQSILQRVAGERLRVPTTASAGVELDVRILYNPEMRAAIFMVPSVLALILCLITIILTAMALVREKEMGTFETLLASPAKPWEILLGKTLPFVALGMLDVPLVLGVAILGFGVPMRGSLVALLLSAFVFVCTTVSIGILISTVAQRQQQAMMASFMFLFPAMMLSGVMFPVENMPAWLRVTAYLDPLKYFVTLMRNIMLKGGNAEVIALNLAILTLMGGVFAALSFNRFKQTLN